MIPKASIKWLYKHIYILKNTVAKSKRNPKLCSSTTPKEAGENKAEKLKREKTE